MNKQNLKKTSDVQQAVMETPGNTNICAYFDLRLLFETDSKSFQLLLL